MSENRPTILVIDDIKENVNILLELLSSEYDIAVALNGKDALEIVNNEAIDLILLDIMMPEMDGYEVCHALCSNKQTKDIPVIFITAKTDIESIEKAFELGGSDYISKPFRPRELMARVKMHLKVQTLQKELKRMATTDMLTGLYNRRQFYELANYALDLANREKHAISILMLDIDKFKNINDAYGHDVGDITLKNLAELLNTLQRQSDIVCRFGGEEFVILLPNTNLNAAISVAEKIREKTQQLKIFYEEERSFSFTLSIGVSQIDFSDEKPLEISLKHADDALYEAKNQGRNRVSSFKNS